MSSPIVTKNHLNVCTRAGLIFDRSAAYEMLCFMSPDVLESAAALDEKRTPRFPSAHEAPRAGEGAQ